VTLLLDTQVMLWWLLGDTRLRDDTRVLIASYRARVSVASVWEVAIKHRIGKLPVDAVSFRDACLSTGATLLEISDTHVIETGNLPGMHEDPFDRLIIAQARTEGLVAVSSDLRWASYDLALRRA